MRQHPAYAVLGCIHWACSVNIIVCCAIAERGGGATSRTMPARQLLSPPESPPAHPTSPLTLPSPPFAPPPLTLCPRSEFNSAKEPEFFNQLSIGPRLYDAYLQGFARSGCGGGEARMAG